MAAGIALEVLMKYILIVLEEFALECLDARIQAFVYLLRICVILLEIVISMTMNTSVTDLSIPVPPIVHVYSSVCLVKKWHSTVP